MDTKHAAASIAEPMGNVGMQFYFTEHSAKAAEPLGIDAILIYAGGRGGVIEGADGAKVDEVFYFFAPGFMGSIAERAWATAGRGETVAAHLAAADAYAADTFGGIDEATLAAFADAVEALVATLPTGRWGIVDGYRSQAMPEGTLQRAYRCAILMRELRGGVHTDAIIETGMDAQMACRVDQDGAFYGIHGYGEASEITPSEEDLARKAEAEALTSERMAELLGVLSDEQLEALVAGALALRSAT